MGTQGLGGQSGSRAIKHGGGLLASLVCWCNVVRNGQYSLSIDSFAPWLVRSSGCIGARLCKTCLGQSNNM